MSGIKLKIDVLEGTLEVECSREDFEAVMSHAEKVLEKFNKTKTVAAERDEPTSESSDGTVSDAAEPVEDQQAPRKAKRKKGVKKTANWKIVDDLLDAPQREQLKAFFAEKAPKRQNDQVAVLAFKLKELLGRDAFDGNEIHTAFRAVGVKTPKSLTSVFSNMARDDLGKIEDKKWVPNFKSDDFVNHNLPVQPKAA